MIYDLTRNAVYRWFGTCAEIRVPGDILILGELAFAGSKVKRIRIGHIVQAIGKQCFSDCVELEETIFDEDSRLEQ